MMSQNVKPGDAPRVLSSFAAGVVEISRNGDYCLADRTNSQLSVLDQLAENNGRERLRPKVPSGDLVS